MSNAVPLQIEHITKSFDKHTVLNDFSLALQPGEIFGLIGLNGVGKTTLIKIILDLLRADAGSIELFGVPSSQIQSRRNVAYLPEKFQPSRYLCGHEYLRFNLAHYGKTLEMESARQLVAALDLNPDALMRQARHYSKGMGQKLGLAGALLVEAPLLILDEPMSGLDPRARICLKQQMQKVRSSGRSIFFSSHILSDIDEICDRIGIIHQGKMFFVGTPQEFHQRYGEATLEKAFLKSIDAVPEAA